MHRYSLSCQMACLYTKCLQAGQPSRYIVRIQISTETRSNFALQKVQTFSGAHPAFSHGPTIWRFEFDHLPPPSAELNERRCASTAAMGLHHVNRHRFNLLLYKVLGKIFGYQEATQTCVLIRFQIISVVLGTERAGIAQTV
jgi:hypothetical protein